jgi:hemerythrin superfamily protein
MNAIELLTEQHRRMERMLSDLLGADASARQPGFDRAADELMSHVLVEEEVFYPAVNAERTEDILLESLEEHLSLKRVLGDLLGLAAADEHFEPKLHVLEEQARHHHKEEEEHLFPKVRKLLSAERLEALGAKMAARQRELLATEPRRLVVTQTRAAADLP